MKFHFKFQKLLDIEKFREEELVKELKLLQKKLHDEEKLLVFLRSVLSLQQSEMEKELCKQSDVRLLVQFESYFLKLNQDIATQTTRVKEATEKLDLVRESLLKVFKRRKVLEKLRERYEQRFKEQLLRAENKHFDEVAVTRYYRRHKT